MIPQQSVEPPCGSIEEATVRHDDSFVTVIRRIA